MSTNTNDNHSTPIDGEQFVFKVELDEFSKYRSTASNAERQTETRKVDFLGGYTYLLYGSNVDENLENFLMTENKIEE